MNMSDVEIYDENLYDRKGYIDRQDYLRCLAEDYDVPLATVHELADLLGPSEDFDGLVSSLQDYAILG